MVNKKEGKEKKKMKEKTNTMWDWLLETGIATEEELQLVTSINGYNIETLNDVLFARTGYRDREQLEEKRHKEKKRKIKNENIKTRD